MSSAPPSLRHRAVVASVLVWLGAVAVVPVVTGLIIVVVTRSVGDPLAEALGVTSVFAIPVIWIAAAFGVAAWAWRARIDAAFVAADRHRFGVPWAAMGWFVPIAGFVIPLLVVTDVVRAVRPAGVGAATVRVWWSAWIAGSVVLPACAVAAAATPYLAMLPAIVLAAVLLVVAAALFTRIALAVAAARDAAFRRSSAQWVALS